MMNLFNRHYQTLATKKQQGLHVDCLAQLIDNEPEPQHRATENARTLICRGSSSERTQLY
jgi:hypothetical protein